MRKVAPVRALTRLPVAPGEPGVRALMAALPDALDGNGPAIAPIPALSATVGAGYVQRLLDATRPDDPSLPLESDEAAVVLSTSGSTGTPRGVLLPARALRAIEGAVVGSASPTWVVAIPVTSAGGLNVLMRSLAAGTEPVALASVGGDAPFTPALFAAGVEEALRRGGDVRTSLVTAQLRRLLADPRATEALRACRLVLVGGGPVDAHTRSAAASLGVPFTATYGATETAGGCVYDGVPLPGVSVAVDERGEVLVRGDVLALGYRGDPAATASRFTEAGYRTGDLGTLVDGRLRITGRMDDVVTVNGVSVSVVAIEELLRGLPDVANAAVVAVPTTGEPAIVAYVQGRDGVTAPGIVDAARDRIAVELGRAAVPRLIECVETVPALPNGKPDRVALRSAAADLFRS